MDLSMQWPNDSVARLTSIFLWTCCVLSILTKCLLSDDIDTFQWVQLLRVCKGKSHSVNELIKAASRVFHASWPLIQYMIWQIRSPSIYSKSRIRHQTNLKIYESRKIRFKATFHSLWSAIFYHIASEAWFQSKAWFQVGPGKGLLPNGNRLSAPILASHRYDSQSATYFVGLAQDCSNSIFGHFDVFTKTDRKISNTSVQ